MWPTALLGGSWCAFCLGGPVSFGPYLVKHAPLKPPLYNRCTCSALRGGGQDDSGTRSEKTSAHRKASGNAVARRMTEPKLPSRCCRTPAYRKFPSGNARLPVRNDYLAAWALALNNLGCLERLQSDSRTIRRVPEGAVSDGFSDAADVDTGVPREGKLEWGETMTALVERLDVVNDLDQRRLAASLYWQRLQDAAPDTSPSSNDISTKSWAEVNALFEEDVDFVVRQRDRAIAEAAEDMPQGWRDDPVSRAWVASYRLSVFESRRQAQRYFAFAIPDKRALDCILHLETKILEVGSGLGYWASLLKARSGDETRVLCLDPYAPQGPVPPPGGGSVDALHPGSGVPSTDKPGSDDDEVDVWFGEGRRAFTSAEPGSFEQIALDPSGYRDWSLLICWPSDGRWPRGCLESFKGKDFFYVGEGEGGATRMPWRLLEEQWELQQKINIPQWPGFNDALWWYRRRGAVASPSDP